MKDIIIRIKNFFFKKKILKPKSTIEKYNYLLSLNINVYDIKSNSTISFLDINIVESINLMKSVLNKDFSNEYVYELNLQGRKTFILPLKKWCSDSGRYLEDIDVIFKEWLMLSKELHSLVEVGMKSVGSGKLYSNSVKAKPHIKNNEIIIDKILSGLTS